MKLRGLKCQDEARYVSLAKAPRSSPSSGLYMAPSRPRQGKSLKRKGKEREILEILSDGEVEIVETTSEHLSSQILSQYF